MILRTVGKAIVQLVLALALMYMFFVWAPWLASEPISAIASVQLPHAEVPATAKSFTISHGAVSFREVGTVSEEPILFGLLTLAMIADFAILVLSFPKGFRGRRRPAQQNTHL